MEGSDTTAQADGDEQGRPMEQSHTDKAPAPGRSRETEPRQPDRRQRARVEGLVLTKRERKRVTKDARDDRAARRDVRATLWEDDPDLSASLHFLCAQASVHLHRVTTADGLRLAANGFQAGDIAIVDRLTATTALGRATAALAATRTDGQPMPVHIAHPSEEFVKALRTTYDRPLVWLPPEWAGLTLLVTLRLLGVSSGTPAQPDAMRTEADATVRPRVRVVGAGEGLPALTAAEEAVLAGLAAGLKQGEIAGEEHMSVATVPSTICTT